MARLWAIVLVANLTGTLIAALLCTYTPVLPPDLCTACWTSAARCSALSWAEMFFRGIASGFLIAAMVWMIPSAESAKFAVVTMMTYLIAIGGFTHIVAGSMEAYMLVLAGDWEWWRMISQFFGAGAVRQYRRRHGAVRADFLRAGDEGNLNAY